MQAADELWPVRLEYVPAGQRIQAADEVCAMRML
jgi:hypothetical protein